MTNEEMQKKILELEAKMEMLNNYSTIPLDVGEAMKARILGKNNIAVVDFDEGVPDTVIVTDTNGSNPPVDYEVCAPFTKQIKLKIGETLFIVPAN